MLADVCKFLIHRVRTRRHLENDVAVCSFAKVAMYLARMRIDARVIPIRVQRPRVPHPVPIIGDDRFFQSQ